MDGTLAVGSIEYAMDELENIKPFLKIHVYESVQYHLTRAKETLSEGIQDPVQWGVVLLLLSTMFQNLQEGHGTFSESSDNLKVVADDQE
jgi:hypothetical protein